MQTDEFERLKAISGVFTAWLELLEHLVPPGEEFQKMRQSLVEAHIYAKKSIKLKFGKSLETHQYLDDIHSD